MAPLHLQWSLGLIKIVMKERGRVMTQDFKVGDHVEWNSEAGRVRGTIQKKHTAEITFKGYRVHASKEQPQYEIKSDTTDHVAMHKGSALTKI
jgi:Hypervirulence associated proteins TUDOR domain